MAHICLFPVTRGHLPRRATFPLNQRWPAVAGNTVLVHWKKGMPKHLSMKRLRPKHPWPKCPTIGRASHVLMMKAVLFFRAVCPSGYHKCVQPEKNDLLPIVCKLVATVIIAYQKDTHKPAFCVHKMPLSPST